MANTFLTRDDDRGDESLADGRAEQLDELLRALPVGLAATIRALPLETDPRNVFEGLWKSCEGLAQHLARMVNTEYMARAFADPGIERSVRELSNQLGGKGPTFGQITAGIRAFAKQDAPWLLDGLDTVLRGKLDVTAATFVAAMRHLNDAKQKFNVPPDYLSAYVKEHLGGSTRSAVTLDDFLGKVGELRNSQVHPKAPNASDAPSNSPIDGESQHWCRTVNHYLAPALCDLLLGSPMFNFLTQFQVVQVVGARAQASTPSPYPVRWPFAALPPAGLGKLAAAGEIALAATDRVVAKVVGPTRGRLEFVARWQQFPTSRNSQDKARTEYRRAFAACLLDDGKVSESERTSLNQLLADRFLTPSDVVLEEKAVWDVCHTVAVWAIGAEGVKPPPALAEYRDDPDIKLPQADDALREHMARCIEVWANMILTSLDDQGPQTATEIVNSTGLKYELVQLTLDNLKKNTELSPVENKGKWARRNHALESRMRDLLANTRKRLEENEVLDNYVWDLLVLAADLMDVAAPTSENDDRETYRTRISTMRDDATTPESLGAELETSDAPLADKAEAAVRGISMEIDGEFLQAAGLARLQRKLGPVLAKRAEEVLKYLQTPHTVGNSRCFVALSPEHANGKPFGYQVEVQVAGTPVYFEANFPRNNGMFLLRHFLEACGFCVTAGAGGEAPVLDDTAAIVSGGEVTALKVSLLQPEDGREVVAAGKTVGEFLKSVFEGLLTLCESKLRANLPREMGRTRNFVSLTPYHRDDKEFRAVVQAGDLYIEAHLSRLHALNLVNELCDTLGIECRDTADEDEEAGESSRTGEALGSDTSEGTTESFQPVELKVHFEDDTLITGKTVREFFRAVLDGCAVRGWMPHVPVPFAASTSRNLLAKDGLHANGRPFRFAVPYEWSGGTFDVEINYDRPRAVEVARALIATVEFAAAAALKQDSALTVSSPD